MRAADLKSEAITATVKNVTLEDFDEPDEDSGERVLVQVAHFAEPGLKPLVLSDAEKDVEIMFSNG